MRRGLVMTPRRGFTLIEVAVVVSITSVLFALSATTIVALLKLERQFASDASLQRALGRLSDHLREDAHQAVTAQCERMCALEMGEGTTVRYAFETPAVVREVRRGDTVEHRDSFTLGRDAKVEFVLESVGSRQLVLMTIDFSAAEGRTRISQVAGPLEIAAAVNLHSGEPMEGMP